MSEFKINRFRYNWRGNWQGTTTYKRDDVILRTGNVYHCIGPHTSTATFATDQPTYWAVMSESSAYRGTWTNAVIYAVNDLVTHGGQIYKCITSHTSQQLFTSNIANWQLYLTSARFLGEWVTGTRYKAAEAVTLSGIVYLANAEHTASGTLETDQSNWDIYFSNIEYRGNFTSNIRYNLNDLVKFGGCIWRCNQSYQAGDDSSLDFNEDFWDIEIPGQNYQGVWNTNTGYGTGDVVKYGGNVYVALRSNQGLLPSVETLDWTLLSKGFNFQGNWSQTNDYAIGQVVRHGGNLYVSNTATVGFELESETLRITITAGQSGLEGNRYAVDGVSYGPTLQFYTGITYRFDQTDLTNVFWPNANITGFVNKHPLHFSADNVNGDGHDATGISYTRNVVYELDGVSVTKSIYNRDFQIARSRVVSITVDRGTPPVLYYYCQYHAGMGGLISVNQATAGIDPALSNDWIVINDGIQWRNGYLDNVSYSIGDLVSYNNKIYKCVVAHVSDAAETFPANGSGTVYWAVYLEGEPDNALERVGDLLSFGVTSDTSTQGAIPVHVGLTDQVLVIQDNDILSYATLGEVTNVFYVSTDGVDSLDRGMTPDKPYASIKFACRQAEKLSGLKTIHVSTGLYNEIGPISVPQSTVILGDELRSVTINVDSSVEGYVNDVVYFKDATVRLLDIIPSIVNNTAIVPSAGNTKQQIRYLQSGSSTIATAIQDKINQIAQYITFHVQSSGVEPPIVGTNTRETSNNVHQTLAVIAINTEFIVHEISAYVAVAFPAYSFSAERYRQDFRLILEALLYDTEYSGNYKSQLAARWYRNSVVPFTDDLFYFRNNTGLRNCTLTGMTGALNPAGVFDLYQLPTGKAYCSLDPGWGPADQTTWITTRSPYIQGVTTIGSNCVGNKIDGALHNGGNRSMVSNDFTQVLSDGVGVWVTNTGRAELVSVFTYYAQVGYLATGGGRIRALNGNCSYGTFGAYAQGRDVNEVPEIAYVYTKNQQAIIASTFSGEFSDSIQLIEWFNAGSEYSSAQFTVVGNGNGAVLEGDEIRDGAVYQARISSADDSTSAGGGGYLTVGNIAQPGGGASTIRLNVGDINTSAEYLGMRITILAGVGLGQYGYIQAYNSGTKTVTVYKESTDTPGWEHVIAGTPLVASFSTNTTYRIEPRPIWPAPVYSANQSAMYIDLEWNSVTFGKTTSTYSVTAPLGSGAGATAASFSVVRNGKKYSVTQLTAGTGYVNEDTLIIPGTNLDGTTPLNNLIITVQAVNGSGAINNFSFEGIGINGAYVAVSAADNRSSYSIDGAQWLSGDNLPSVGIWKITAGQNKFVAIKFNSNQAAVSTNGISWTAVSLPTSKNWTAVVYGNNKFVALASDLSLNSAAYSADGVNWTAVTLPAAVDSTYSEWSDIAYGAGKFIAIANSNNQVAVSSDAITWTTQIIDVSASTQVNWTAIAYGNNRFIALASQGLSAYSFDGSVWYGSELPTQDGSTIMYWKGLAYGQGVFVAICDTGGAPVAGDANSGETNFIASSENGVAWIGRTLASSRVWRDVVFGNNNDPRWVIIAPTLTMNYMKLGATTRGRVIVSGSNRLQQIRLWEPGSSYSTVPNIVIVDPNNTSDAYIENRIGDGALANPSFVNRGQFYSTNSTRTTVVGDGYADVVPVGATVVLSNLDVVPGPGAQLVFEGKPLQSYSVSTVTIISQSAGNTLASLTVTPNISDFDNFFHGQAVSIFGRNSVIRITGHDFLEIGTGNFEETNYPAVDVLDLQPFNEVVETNLGRVFYTSTDQDGNFRAGELFAVEQSTGIVTISAAFFDFQGLTELQLGGVTIGGSGVVIREFSTDATFSANSNNIVPTQRATKAFLASRLSAGGEELNIPTLTAGQIQISASAIAKTTAGGAILFPIVVDFTGPKAGINGRMLAQAFYFNSFNTE